MLGSGYIGRVGRGPGTSLLALSSVCVDFCQLRSKMVKTRRPLGSLASFVNVNGEGSLQRRVRETTPVERQTMAIYQRREEAWRPLNKQRMAAFTRLFLMCFVEVENGLGLQRVTYQMMKKTLRKRIIPWIYRWLVFSMDEQQWPITLAQFRQLDSFLAEHMPRVQKEDEWDTVAYFFKEMLKQREEYQRLEDMERVVMAAVQRCLEH